MVDDSITFWIGDGPDDSTPAPAASDRLLWMLIVLAIAVALATTFLSV